MARKAEEYHVSLLVNHWKETTKQDSKKQGKQTKAPHNWQKVKRRIEFMGNIARAAVALIDSNWESGTIQTPKHLLLKGNRQEALLREVSSWAELSHGLNRDQIEQMIDVIREHAGKHRMLSTTWGVQMRWPAEQTTGKKKKEHRNAFDRVPFNYGNGKTLFKKEALLEVFKRYIENGTGIEQRIKIWAQRCKMTDQAPSRQTELKSSDLDVLEVMGEVLHLHPVTRLAVRIAFNACQRLNPNARASWSLLRTFYTHRSYHGPLLAVWSARLEVSKIAKFTRLGSNRTHYWKEREKTLLKEKREAAIESSRISIPKGNRGDTLSRQDCYIKLAKEQNKIQKAAQHLSSLYENPDRTGVTSCTNANLSDKLESKEPNRADDSARVNNICQSPSMEIMESNGQKWTYKDISSEASGRDDDSSRFPIRICNITNSDEYMCMAIEDKGKEIHSLCRERHNGLTYMSGTVAVGHK